MHPDTLTCPQFKSRIVTDFWLRDSLYRDTRNAQQTLYWTAKTAPYPPFPTGGDLLVRIKTSGRPELRRVTQPPHIAGPLGGIEKHSE